MNEASGIIIRSSAWKRPPLTQVWLPGMKKAADLPRRAPPPPSATDDYAFYWFIFDLRRCSWEYFTQLALKSGVCSASFKDIGSVLMSGDPLDLCHQPAAINQSIISISSWSRSC